MWWACWGLGICTFNKTTAESDAHESLHTIGLVDSIFPAPRSAAGEVVQDHGSHSPA
jgi:hypothetical protein